MSYKDICHPAHAGSQNKQISRDFIVTLTVTLFIKISM